MTGRVRQPWKTASGWGISDEPLARRPVDLMSRLREDRWF
jgi:hypothetical protein